METGTTSDGRDSLVDWFREHGRHVRVLSGTNTEYCEDLAFKSVVDASASAPTAVSSVLMENCHSMSELALLTSLQTVALEGPEETVDLDPLQALHGLPKLYLAGGVTPFHQGTSCTTLPSHLTSLYGTQLFVETENSGDTTLKKLALYDSALIVEHDKLVSAYEGFEELQLLRSNVYTHTDERPEFTQYNYNSPFQFWCPSDFSALKALRVLNIRAEDIYSGVTGFTAKWALHGLPCLQELTLQCVGLDLVIDEGFADLTALCKLKLTAGRFSSSEPTVGSSP